MIENSNMKLFDLIIGLSSIEKKDYFNYGGKSEFFGHPLDTQEIRIKKGLEKFKELFIQKGQSW